MIIRKEQATQKLMLIVFFDSLGVVHHQWVPQGQGVDCHLYLAFMRDLREAVRRKHRQQ